MEIILASEHLFAGSKREPEVRDRDLSAFVGTARSSESLAALRNRPLPAIFCTANTSDKPYFYTYILHLNTCYVRSRRALTFSPLIFWPTNLTSRVAVGSFARAAATRLPGGLLRAAGGARAL